METQVWEGANHSQFCGPEWGGAKVRAWVRWSDEARLQAVASSGGLQLGGCRCQHPPSLLLTRPTWVHACLSAGRHRRRAPSSQCWAPVAPPPASWQATPARRRPAGCRATPARSCRPRCRSRGTPARWSRTGSRFRRGPAGKEAERAGPEAGVEDRGLIHSILRRGVRGEEAGEGKVQGRRAGSY